MEIRQRKTNIRSSNKTNIDNDSLPQNSLQNIYDNIPQPKPAYKDWLIDFVKTERFKSMDTNLKKATNMYGVRESIKKDEVTGKTIITQKKDFVFIQALADWLGVNASNSSTYLPIFSPPRGGNINSPLTVRNEITDDMDNTWIFLIASPYHAMIYILPEAGKLYTCGFGYADTTKENTRKNNKLGGIMHRVDHAQEVLIGGIYTSDYMAPTTEHESRLIWSGIMNQSIIDRLNGHLSKVDLNSDLYQKKNQKQYVLPTKFNYREGQGQTNNADGPFNCFTWAKYILDAKISCFVNNPSECNSVSQDLWNNLVKETNSKGRKDIIEAMKKSIEDEAQCCGIGRWLPGCMLCGGKRHLQKTKKKIKRKQLTKKYKKSNHKKK